MKSRISSIILRGLSALLCLQFLNLSIDTHRYFSAPKTLTKAEIPVPVKETHSYFELLLEIDNDLENPVPEKEADENDTNNPEEESKKYSDDDEYYTSHKKHASIASEAANNYFSSDPFRTHQFCSEIVPPPPKA